MPVDERARLHLVRRLEETLGPEAAASLMALVSHERFAGPATIVDTITRQTRTIVFTMGGAVVSLGGIAVALAGLG